MKSFYVHVIYHLLLEYEINIMNERTNNQNERIRHAGCNNGNNLILISP